ncbi:hypothetical protein LINPERPRIM_LOCUS38059 [Linum perenne]
MCRRKRAERDGEMHLQSVPILDDEKAQRVANWRFNQDLVRQAAAAMIMLDELSFRFVEHVGFKRLMETACPMFDMPSRKTIRADCKRRRIGKSIFFQGALGGFALLLIVGLLFRISTICALLLTSLMLIGN